MIVPPRKLALAASIFLLPLLTHAHAQTPPQQKPAAPKQGTSSTTQQPTVATSPAVQAPSSKHYPILVVAHGANPTWSLRIGMKGPERLDRANYPPIILDPAEIVPADAGGSWVYHAKDDATDADVTITLARQPCDDPANPAGPKLTFTAQVVHSQIGTLTGCALSQPDLFPEFLKKNQIDDSAINIQTQTEKEKEAAARREKLKVLDPITKAPAPVDYAFIDPAGKIIVVRGATRKTAATSGSKPSLSHDGRKLVYTRSDSSTAPNRTLVLWEFDTGRSRDIVSGNARQGFFSPDDSRIAFLNFQNGSWQLWQLPVNAPEKAAPIATQNYDDLHGWASPNSLLLTDKSNAYWLSDGSASASTNTAPAPSSSQASPDSRHPERSEGSLFDRSAASPTTPGTILQTIPLKDIYGPQFDPMGNDTLRAHPLNPDLLV